MHKPAKAEKKFVAKTFPHYYFIFTEGWSVFLFFLKDFFFSFFLFFSFRKSKKLCSPSEFHIPEWTKPLGCNYNWQLGMVLS